MSPTRPQTDLFDLAIVGAGPAGLSAAVEAAGLGLSVALLDEQARVGGQIYRAIERPGPSDPAQVLGKDYLAGRPLAQSFRASGCSYLPGSSVWQVERQEASPEGPNPGFEIFYSQQGQAMAIKAKALLIASGAMERAFPIPGWQLPGVMTAGAAQTLLKGQGLVAEEAVFAGSGPLLYLVAAQYRRAGVPIKLLIDTTPAENRWTALRQLPGALRHPRLLIKGLKLLADLRRSGTRVLKADRLEALGNGKLEKLRYRRLGSWQETDCDQLFLHHGLVPNVNLAMACGVTHDWNDQQLAWVPQLDDWGYHADANLFLAGDGAGIAGAKAAELRGRLAALEVTRQLGHLSVDQRNALAGQLRLALKKELAFRPFLDSLYRPADSLRLPQSPDTLVCRCEEVPAKEIDAAVKLGCVGPNQLKSFTRCGMGPCQGRGCGHLVSEMMAKGADRPVTAVGYYRLRPPIKPLRLEELASLESSAD
ncbi:FAD-dependent oxidoreductase [Rhodovibrionaceae bacterium A322]